ncbi:hypothetical protein [Streptomyces sp. CBMA29]|uniref:hypothetical protein n=1 Tax=Streptomyces sp. CBMA29 TaxID=1896314 RepID=UPI001661A5D6|nr:hypothetical protein [Streptomyces sp. CBMA29]MBD0734097.1 hypothetical protein [Streptomyces sp. CBMA29]
MAGYGELPLWMGIDPSYAGFAWVGIVESDSIPGGLGTLDAREDYSAATAGKGAARLELIYRNLSRFLVSLTQHYRVKGIAIEGYAPGAKFNREALGELGGVTRLAVHQALSDVCPPALIVPPMSVKKFATGKGTAPKDNVLLAVYKKWGIEFQSNDLADAYTIARIARAVDRGADLEYEQEVLRRLSPARERGGGAP